MKRLGLPILVLSILFVFTGCGEDYDDSELRQQVEGNPNFKIIDIGQHIHNLKEFLDLRDNNPAFDEAKKVGDVGIPCYVLEDGSVTLSSKDVGLEPMLESNGAACQLDGTGC